MPDLSPKGIDMTADLRSVGEECISECIYKLEGERLTICFPERPKEFASGKGRSTIVMERLKGE